MSSHYLGCTSNNALFRRQKRGRTFWEALMKTHDLGGSYEVVLLRRHLKDALFRRHFRTHYLEGTNEEEN